MNLFKHKYPEDNSLAMVNLSIDLQEGFSDDTVIVGINEEQVFRQDHVTTQVHGLAATFTTKVKEGSVMVNVKIETRGISGSMKLELTSNLYLGVSIMNKELNFIKSLAQFGYA